MQQTFFWINPSRMMPGVNKYRVAVSGDAQIILDLQDAVFEACKTSQELTGRSAMEIMFYDDNSAAGEPLDVETDLSTLNCGKKSSSPIFVGLRERATNTQQPLSSTNTTFPSSSTVDTATATTSSTPSSAANGNNVDPFALFANPAAVFNGPPLAFNSFSSYLNDPVLATITTSPPSIPENQTTLVPATCSPAAVISETARSLSSPSYPTEYSSQFYFDGTFSSSSTPSTTTDANDSTLLLGAQIESLGTNVATPAEESSSTKRKTSPDESVWSQELCAPKRTKTAASVVVRSKETLVKKRGRPSKSDKNSIDLARQTIKAESLTPGADSPPALMSPSNVSPNSTATTSPRSVSPSGSSDNPNDSLGAPRKKTHNAIEKKYRNNINDRIAQLKQAVPALLHAKLIDSKERQARRKARLKRAAANGQAPPGDSDSDEESDSDELMDGVSVATKLNKATILKKATDYIKYLQKCRTRLEAEVEMLRNGVTDASSTSSSTPSPSATALHEQQQHQQQQQQQQLQQQQQQYEQYPLHHQEDSNDANNVADLGLGYDLFHFQKYAAPGRMFMTMFVSACIFYSPTPFIEQRPFVHGKVVDLESNDHFSASSTATLFSNFWMLLKVFAIGYLFSGLASILTGKSDVVLSRNGLYNPLIGTFVEVYTFIIQKFDEKVNGKVIKAKYPNVDFYKLNVETFKVDSPLLKLYLGLLAINNNPTPKSIKMAAIQFSSIEVFGLKAFFKYVGKSLWSDLDTTTTTGVLYNSIKDGQDPVDFLEKSRELKRVFEVATSRDGIEHIVTKRASIKELMKNQSETIKSSWFYKVLDVTSESCIPGQVLPLCRLSEYDDNNNGNEEQDKEGVAVSLLVRKVSAMCLLYQIAPIKQEARLVLDDILELLSQLETKHHHHRYYDQEEKTRGGSERDYYGECVRATMVLSLLRMLKKRHGFYGEGDGKNLVYLYLRRYGVPEIVIRDSWEGYSAVFEHLS